MVRLGVAAAALAIVVTCQAPALAQSSPERWSAAVFVRSGEGSVPLAIRVADKRAQRASSDLAAEMPPLPERKGTTGGPGKMTKKPEPEVWQPQEIAAAKAQCVKLLKGIQAVAVPQPPLRDGRCGTPAPIRLHSLGRVTFQPAPLLDCEMAATLSTWLKNDLQPLAIKHLGSRITKIEVMSDYSCRNVFGTKRLSEHSYANALDIGGFVTEGGKTATVLANWGKNRFDIAAEKEAAKAKAEAARRSADVAQASGSLPDARKRSDRIAAAADKLNGPRPPEDDKAAGTKYAALSPPPAPLPKPEVAVPRAPQDREGRFLHAAHASACRIFGTTLGPEANKAHRNHFHVDMAVRKWKKICD